MIKYISLLCVYIYIYIYIYTHVNMIKSFHAVRKPGAEVVGTQAS